MKRQLLALLIICIAILAVIFWIPTNRASLSQGEIRAALDIGSGATNLKIARVDPKTDKIIVSLFEESLPVPYQKHLEQSPNHTFDTQIMSQGIRAIKTLTEFADSYHVEKIVAVATAAFREAANAQQFAHEIECTTGVKVRIISQEEEGVLAFRGALALTAVAPQQAVVWDIGGGSMQFTTLASEDTYLVDKGQTASIPFKKAVIQDIKHQDMTTTQSPNPLTKEEIQAALAYAARLAHTTTPFIAAKLQEPQTHVLAVGHLFNRGIRPLVDQQIVRSEALEQVVMQWADQIDAQLPGGQFVDVTITNPVLVLGYMQGLKIKQVEVVDVNNTDGALTYPPWQQEKLDSYSIF